MLILLLVTKSGRRLVFLNANQIASIQPRRGSDQSDPGAFITLANGDPLEVEESVQSILDKLSIVQGESRLDDLETQVAALETRVTTLESQQ